MKVHPHMLQGSEEWFAIRKGRPTGSNADKILTPGGALSKSAVKYMDQLIGESFAPEEESFFGTKWTDRGQDLEGEAIEAFEAQTKIAVQRVGFCVRDNCIAGCSPDFLIQGAGGYSAGGEVKCKSAPKHVEMVRLGVLPDENKLQVHFSLVVTGLPLWHFWAWHPQMRPLHVEVRPDNFTEKVRAALDQFVKDYALARAELMPRLRLPEAA